MDSAHFLNKPLDNLVTYIAKNGCYNLNQEFNANVLDLTTEKRIFPLFIWMTLKNSNKCYPPIISFLMH